MTPYEQAQVEINRLLAKVERLEAAALSLGGHPYQSDEVDYWKNFHHKKAEAYDNLADELEEM